MNKWMRIALFGVGVWAVPFAFGMVVFSLQKSNPAFFDTLMTIGMTASAVFFGILYLRKRPCLENRDAIGIGFAWLIICLLIDFPILVVGIGMDIHSYMSDIGVGYLIVPIIFFALAYMSRAVHVSDDSSSTG